MSTQTQSSNVYSMYKQNVQKYFENISKITPEYFQAITQLQDECMKTCEKTINTSISTQQEFAKNAGISTEIQDADALCMDAFVSSRGIMLVIPSRWLLHLISPSCEHTAVNLTRGLKSINMFNNFSCFSIFTGFKPVLYTLVLITNYYHSLPIVYILVPE